MEADDNHNLTQGFKEGLLNITKRIDSGEKIDILSCSLASEGYQKKLELVLDSNISSLSKMEVQNKLNERKDKYSFLLRTFFEYNSYLEELSKRNIRIFIGSGNEGKSHINNELIPYKTEDVGSLNKKGQVSDFSASRNTMFTKHYELGEYEPKTTTEGFNITGIPGTDIPFDEIVTENNLNSKTIEDGFNETEKFKKEMAKLEGRKALEFFMKYDGIVNFSDYINIGNNMDLIVKKDNDRFFAGKYIHPETQTFLKENKNGTILPYIGDKLEGTSLSTPVRSAKIALNNMMEGVLDKNE